ncbi:MAG: hypothetical protein K2L13_04315, partial [Opitutales bacterium]|nr:hypothetical protein [Opitutales bacterium]
MESSRNPSTENSNARIDPIQEQNPTQTNLQDRPVTLSSPDGPMSISDLKAKARAIITEYLKLPFDDDDDFEPNCDGWLAIEQYFSDPTFEGTAYGIEHIEKNPWRLHFIYAMDFVFNDVLKGICGTYRDLHTFGDQSVSQLFLLAVRLARLILSTPEPSRQILRIKILEIFNQFVRAYSIDRLNHGAYAYVVWRQVRQEIQQILQPIILQQIMLQIQLEQQKQQEALEQLKRDISEIKFQQNDISILEYFGKYAAAHYAFITQADVHTPLLLNIPTLQEFMHQIFEYCCIVPSSVEKINDICVLKIIEYVQQFHALFSPKYLSPTIRDVIRLHVYDILNSHQVNFSSDFQACMDLSAKMLSVVENFPKGQILANVPDRETLRRNIAQIRSQQGQISTLKYFNECAKTYYAFIMQSSARTPFLFYTPTLQEFMNQVFEYCCIIPNSVKNIRSECVLRIIEYIQKFHTRFPLDISLPSVQYIIIQHICNILEIYEVKFSQNAQSSMKFFEKLLSVGEHLPEYQRDQLVATFNDILHN